MAATKELFDLDPFTQIQPSEEEQRRLDSLSPRVFLALTSLKAAMDKRTALQKSNEDPAQPE